jgi:hypothetical protein
MDPVQAKCEEIKTMLKNSQPFVTEDVVTEYITRQTILKCCYMYGKRFQPNFPILHAPSFNLSHTPPILLLAVTLAGAVFEKGHFPAATLNRLAMRLLLIIEIERVRMLLAADQSFIDGIF